MNNLHTKKAELSAVGVVISHDDYRSAIIQSLPCWLASYASNQLTALHLFNQTVNPDILIIFICDEWDRTHPTGKGGSQHDGDDALVVEGVSKEKGRGKGKGKGKTKGPCWECSGEHWKRDCPNKRDKKGGSSNAPIQSNANANTVEEEDCSFMIEEMSDVDGEAGCSEFNVRSEESQLEDEFDVGSEESWARDEFDDKSEE